MHTPQTSLGKPTPYPYPRFDHVGIAKVTGTTLYESMGRVEIQFINDGGLAGGVAVPAYVVESGLSVTPEEGELVLVGFIHGDKDNPWLIGTFKGKAATSGMLMLTKDGFVVNAKMSVGTITDLETQITTLNGQVADLLSRVEALESR